MLIVLINNGTLTINKRKLLPVENYTKNNG